MDIFNKIWTKKVQNHASKTIFPKWKMWFKKCKNGFKKCNFQFQKCYFRIILNPKSENIDSKIAYFYLTSVFFDSKSASFDLNVVFLLIKDVIFYSKSVFFIQKVWFSIKKVRLIISWMNVLTPKVITSIP